ncbi:MAG TPA: VCBS repeat-containing protein [Steroidobacteraceae bacterium]|nr:VCBS repeat-containing protein [Steroidobacteraceae bacterium]
MKAQCKDSGRGGRTLGIAGTAVLLTLLAGCHDDDYYYGGPVISLPGYTPNSVAVADVNGDGIPDLLVATTVDNGQASNPGVASVYLGSSSSPGTYLKGVDYPTTGTNPSGIAVTDITGAGGKDMIVANFGNGNATIFMHDPANPGKFLAGVTLTTGGQPNQVVTADLNGDGRPDFVFADLSSSGNAIVVLQNSTTAGQFQPPVDLSTGNLTTSVAVGDLNGDGKPDIVAANYDSNGNNGQVTIFFQSATTPGTFAAGVSFPAGAQPQSVKILDVNGDGLPDLIVANQGPGSDGTGAPGVSILLQDATHRGTFLAPITYSTPSGAIDVAVGDLNGDGKPDLVVASLGPAPTGAVSVLLQSSTTAGTFGTATSYPGYGQPLSVAIADLNGDGHPDIAVADADTATVLLQIAASPGTFNNPVVVN